MKVFFVNKRLAFGSAIKTKAHVKQLKALGITHVINLRWSGNNAKVREFKHKWFPFHDDMKPRPKWFYRRTSRFYKKVMKQQDARLFIMCHHGICRSASLTYFFLRTSGESRANAELTIKGARRAARIVPAYRESGEKYLQRIEQS